MTPLPDDEIVQAMEIYGGSFVARLGALFRYADPENRALLKAAFRHYWVEYAELAILTRKV